MAIPFQSEIEVPTIKFKQSTASSVPTTLAARTLGFWKDNIFFGDSQNKANRVLVCLENLYYTVKTRPTGLVWDDQQQWTEKKCLADMYWNAGSIWLNKGEPTQLSEMNIVHHPNAVVAYTAELSGRTFNVLTMYIKTYRVAVYPGVDQMTGTLIGYWS